MIYVDTSVVLAGVFVEAHRLTDEFWISHVVSSRLTSYEAWNFFHRVPRAASSERLLQALLRSITMIELRREVFDRALHPFPSQIRTLDALHIETACFVAEQGADVTFATFDRQQAKAASAIGLKLLETKTD